MSVQSTSEDGFHLLSLGSLILQPGTVDCVRQQYTQQYSCCVNTIDIQGVDLPLLCYWATGQLCAAPPGVSPPSLGGKHVATSQSAPAEDIH